MPHEMMPVLCSILRPPDGGLIGAIALRFIVPADAAPYANRRGMPMSDERIAPNVHSS
jgi:hypothetical protein